MLTPNSRSSADETAALLAGFDPAAVREFERIGPLFTGAQHSIIDTLNQVAAAVKACGMDLTEQQNALGNVTAWLHATINRAAIDVLVGSDGAP